MPLGQNPLETYFSSPPHSNPQTQSGHTDSANLAAGVLAGIGIAGGLYAAYSCIYKWVTDPSPLSKEDLKRYRAMTTAYRKMGIEIPSRWFLDGKKPTYCMNYSEIIHSLEETINQLLLEHSGMHLARASILLLIKRYLESIEARSTTTDTVFLSYDRPDGVEAMFLYEMVLWFQIIVPNLHDLNEETAATFEKRIAYCREIFIRITKNHWHNQGRANFKDFLERLIGELQEYHSYLIQRIETANFNDLINRLGDNLLSLSAQSFNILHLLINGVNQSNLLVKQFIRPYESDVKVLNLRSKKLGKWLLETLKLADITNSTFESNATITLEEISQHLDAEIPGDEGCTLKPKEIISSEWGHWPFVLSEPPSQRRTSNLTVLSSKQKRETLHVHEYLKSIREFHRLVLQFYYIRKNLLRITTVANFFGERWIYGDPVGKVLLDELLTNVSEIVQEYRDKFKLFWESYFDEHYVRYAKAHKIDDYRNDCHNWLNMIDQVHKVAIGKISNNIERTIMKIRNQALKLPETEVEIRKIKIDLISELLALLKFKEKTNKLNYKIMAEALEKEQQHDALTREVTPILVRAESHKTLQERIRQKIDSEVQRQMVLFVQSLDSPDKSQSKKLRRANSETKLGTDFAKDFETQSNLDDHIVSMTDEFLSAIGVTIESPPESTPAKVFVKREEVFLEKMERQEKEFSDMEALIRNSVANTGVKQSEAVASAELKMTT